MNTIPEKYRVNTALVTRFEAASAFPPISTGALQDYERMSRLVNDSKTWEDVPADVRARIEQAEANGNLQSLGN